MYYAHVSLVFHIKRINVHSGVFQDYSFFLLGVVSCYVGIVYFYIFKFDCCLSLFYLFISWIHGLHIWQSDGMNHSVLCKENCVLLSLSAAGREEEKVLFLSSLTDHDEG